MTPEEHLPPQATVGELAAASAPIAIPGQGALRTALANVRVGMKTQFYGRGRFRLSFQETMGPTAMRAVAELVGRKVLTYQSQIVFGPARAFEIFVGHERQGAHRDPAENRRHRAPDHAARPGRG
jgi:hypothetical protein